MTEPLYIPAPLGGTNDRMLAAYADAIRDQTIEGFRIYHVHVSMEWMPQLDEFVSVTVLIDDPPAGTESWPGERRRALRRAVAGMAWQFGIAESISVHPVKLRSALEAGIPAEVVVRARAAAEQRVAAER